jgi:hypothetical protein
MAQATDQVYAECKSLAERLRLSGQQQLASALDWCDQPWNMTTEFWINYLQTLRSIRRKLFFAGARQERKAASRLIGEVRRIISSANSSW